MGKIKLLMQITISTAVLTVLGACGGGGGGDYSGGGGGVLYYPYETVYGDVCTTQSPTPGCTFVRSTGARVAVSSDPDYNRYGYGSDDLRFVKFDYSGNAAVYDDLGHLMYTQRASDFSGFVGGTTIGVGTSGFFWENVAGGTYWLGRNGVLYSANTGSGNFGKAINDKSSSEASDANFAALNSDANKALVRAGADKLIKQYGFQKEKAVAVASALNSWAVAAAERGYTTGKDMDKTFRSVFGVNFSDALSAIKDLRDGDVSGMQDVTERSAAALGLKPHQAQQFIKGMYKKAMAQYGYDIDQVSW